MWFIIVYPLISIVQVFSPLAEIAQKHQTAQRMIHVRQPAFLVQILPINKCSQMTERGIVNPAIFKAMPPVVGGIFACPILQHRSQSIQCSLVYQSERQFVVIKLICPPCLPPVKILAFAVIWTVVASIVDMLASQAVYFFFQPFYLLHIYTLSGNGHHAGIASPFAIALCGLHLVQRISLQYTPGVFSFAAP
jgi:hypothetical protein